MKKNILILALVFCATVRGLHAGSLITDGDFDALPVGSAPDKNQPAGHWFWPSDYQVAGGNFAAEYSASQFSIVPAPGAGSGNALRLSFTSTENTGGATYLPNRLARSITRDSREIIHASFDVYVLPGHGGGGAILSKGDIEIADRGPQLTWDPSGRLAVWNRVGGSALVTSYPRGVWQSIRLNIDLARQRYDVFWSENGQPASVVRTNLQFNAITINSSTIGYIDRFTVLRFGVEGLEDAQSYFDNIRVTTDPAIAPVLADVPAGAATTLSAVNLPAGEATFQWRHKFTDIPGATAVKLELTNVTAEQAGEYTLVVSAAGKSTTTDASTVRVFDRLTITTPPVSIDALSGKATGFSVAAVSASPMTYQWRFNNIDLPDKTNRFLTLTANAATAGDYTVVVSDANGSITSEPATLRVLVPVTFTQAPLNQRVVAGSTVTLSAAIQGTGAFTYQLRKGSAFDSSTVQSTLQTTETTAFFTLTNVQPSQAGTYRLYVSNPAAPTLGSTSPSRSCTLTVLPDTDGDGLPDEWETANGLNPADPSDALLDSDGDGISNLTEYRSGTAATNSASGLRFESVAHANGKASLSFTAAANQTYTIEASTQASGGTWEKVTDVVAQAAERIEKITHDSAAGPTRFYRIVTPRRP